MKKIRNNMPILSLFLGGGNEIIIHNLHFFTHICDYLNKRYYFILFKLKTIMKKLDIK
jgi:hypothetical protein